MRKMICSPGTYIQGAGELTHLAEHVKNLGKESAYLIMSPSVYKRYHEEIEHGLESAGLRYKIRTFGGECCDEEIEKHRLESAGYEVIVGIGGGKVLDTAKAAAYYENSPVIIAPTVASSDAPCSRLSVVYTPDGKVDHFVSLTRNPDLVLMDSAVIAKAPARFLAAGMGDALSTYYEALACNKSNAVTRSGGHVTKTALALAKLCRDTLMEDGYQAYLSVKQGLCTKAVENVIEANTYLSGVGFESGGLAGAHAIQNGLTLLEETHKYLHGEKVAFGTIAQLVLENYPLHEIKDIIAFCKKISLPTSLDELGLAETPEEKLYEAAKSSCSPNFTMKNLPFQVTPEEVLAAMKLATALSKEL